MRLYFRGDSKVVFIMVLTPAWNKKHEHLNHDKSSIITRIIALIYNFNRLDKYTSTINKHSPQVRYFDKTIFSLQAGEHFPHNKILIPSSCRQILPSRTQRTVKNPRLVPAMQRLNPLPFQIPQNDLILRKPLTRNKLPGSLRGNNITNLRPCLNLLHNLPLLVTPYHYLFVRRPPSRQEFLLPGHPG